MSPSVTLLFLSLLLIPPSPLQCWLSANMTSTSSTDRCDTVSQTGVPFSLREFIHNRCCLRYACVYVSFASLIVCVQFLSMCLHSNIYTEATSILITYNVGKLYFCSGFVNLLSYPIPSIYLKCKDILHLYTLKFIYQHRGIQGLVQTSQNLFNAGGRKSPKCSESACLHVCVFSC